MLIKLKLCLLLQAAFPLVMYDLVIVKRPNVHINTREL